MNQRVKFEVYDEDQNFLTNIEPERVNDYPPISQEINRGYGEVMMKLGYPYDNYPTWIDFGHFIKIWVIDDYSPSGELMYSGYISDISPSLDGSEEEISIKLYPNSSFLSRRFYKDGTSFTVSITAQDPSDALEDLFDAFDLLYPGIVGYTVDSIDSVGVNITFDIVKSRYPVAISKIFSLVDPNWYYRYDPDGTFHMHQFSAIPDHYLTVGKNVRLVRPIQTLQEVVNKQVVDYDGGSVEVDNSASQTTYGVHEGEPITDTNIKDLTTATQRGTQEVINNKDPKFSGTIEVTFSDFDIKTLKVGQIIQLENVNGTNPILTLPLIISKTTYNYETVTLELGYVRSRLAVLLNKFFTYNQQI